MPRILAPAIVMSMLAAAAWAQTEPEWNDVIVQFHLAANGTLHVAEQLQVDVPGVVQQLERVYWTDAGQQMRVESITRYDGDSARPLARGNLDIGNHYESFPGRIVWSVRDKLAPHGEVQSLLYVIRFTVSDAVIPAWSIPRGPQDRGDTVRNPLTRVRDAMPLWREAMKSPRSRYLLDYQYDMPPPSTKGTTIQLQLYWANGWKPVRTITGDAIAKEIDRDAANPVDRWRVTHLFDYVRGGVPPAVDVRAHRNRIAAIAGFPIAAALLWLAFALIGRSRAERADVDERFLRETLLHESPDMIAARWSGRAPLIALEPFLRRLEHQHKISLHIEHRTVSFDDGETAEDDPLVKVRLLVGRDRLTPYERAGIDALMGDGREIDSDEFLERHNGTDYDPTEALQAELTKAAEESGAQKKSPWPLRFFSLALFGAGAGLVAIESAAIDRNPVTLVATLAGCALLAAVRIVPDARRGSLLLLVPAILATLAVAGIQLMTDLPPGVSASIGVSLAFLGAYNAILSSSATRGKDYARLAKARRWLRKELRSANPHLRDDMIPYLHALGLEHDLTRWRRRHQRSAHFSGVAGPEVEEDWGGVFMT